MAIRKLTKMGLSNKSSSDVILDILSEEYPLSAKEIHYKTKRTKEVSYQAVHKMLNELSERGVVEKVNSKYKLNIEWVEKQRKTFDKLEQRYKSGIKNKSPDFGQFTFESIYESDRFLFDFIAGQMQENKRPKMSIHWCHHWVPLFLSKKEYSMLSSLGTFFEVYYLVKGNTLVDRWCAKFWNGHGVNAKTGCDCASTVDLLSVNGYLLEVFYPLEIKEELEEIYSSVKNVSELDLNRLFKRAFEKKSRISIIINKNEDLAKEIEKQTLKYFK